MRPMTQGMPEQGMFADSSDLCLIDDMDIDDRRRFAVLAAVTVDARNQAQQAIDYALCSKSDTRMRLRDVLRISKRLSVPWLVDPFLFNDDDAVNTIDPGIWGRCLSVVTSDVVPFISMAVKPTMHQAATALGLALGSRTYHTGSPQDIMDDHKQTVFEIQNTPMTYDYRWEELWMTSDAAWFARVYSHRLRHAGRTVKPMDKDKIVQAITQEFDQSITGRGGGSARIITNGDDVSHLALQVLTPYFLDALIDGGPDDLEWIMNGLRTGGLHDMGEALMQSIAHLTPPNNGWDTPASESHEEVS